MSESLPYWFHESRTDRVAGVAQLMKRASDDASVLVEGPKMARADKGVVWLGKVLDGGVDDSNADPAFLESVLQQRSASMPLSKRLDYLSGCLGRADDIAAPAELRDKVGGVKQAVAGEAYRSLDEAGADAGPVVLAGIESRTLSRKLLKSLLEKVGYLDMFAINDSTIRYACAL